MLRVALTGGMGSGKSTAVAIFQRLGCFVSQSDEVARSMMQPGAAVYERMVQHFGRVVVRQDGSLDRGALARIAFADGRVEELNSIIHPAVIAAQSDWMRGIGELHPRAVAMIESALVFETVHGHHGQEEEIETPWRKRFDCIVLVTAPEPLRIERYIARQHASSSQERAVAEDDARARMRAQMPEEEKARLSDLIIENDGSVEMLELRVRQVWQELDARAAATA